ncbi:MAG: response regulator [Nitrospira sp.]|nr:response regulator [Nitrospira sp. BO4]
MTIKTREHVQSQDRIPAPHDQLTQSLIVMRMQLRQAAPLVPDKKAAGLLNDLDQALIQALNYTRSLVVELQPPTDRATVSLITPSHDLYGPVLAPGNSDARLTPGDEPSTTASDTQLATPPSSSEFSTDVPHQKPPIRVLLVDDHSMVRQGLRSLLEGYSDIEVVGEAADGQESLDYVEHLRPSVVVMDLNMPKMNGVDATAVIKSRYPQTIVLGLSVNAGHDNYAAMTQAGASALLTKEAAVDQLYDMIHQALAAKP